MIQPVNNVIRQEGERYLVLPNGHFNNVFPEGTHPTPFRRYGRTYLGFLHDSEPPTIYQVMKLNSTPIEEPVEIRKLSIIGAKRIHSLIVPMLQLYVSRANSNIRENAENFRRHVEAGAMCEAEKDIEATKQSLEITVGRGFFHDYVRLPEGLYDRLDTCPEKMSEELTPQKYRQGVNYYLAAAGKQGNQGWANIVLVMCNKAEYCAKKGFEPDNLQTILNNIKQVRKTSFSTGKSIERDREIVLRFSWRRPNTRESWRAGELGYDPYPLPSEEEMARIFVAKRRLIERGLSP